MLHNVVIYSLPYTCFQADLLFHAEYEDMNYTSRQEILTVDIFFKYFKFNIILVLKAFTLSHQYIF